MICRLRAGRNIQHRQNTYIYNNTFSLAHLGKGVFFLYSLIIQVSDVNKLPRNFTLPEGNQREFLFYVSFQNKRSKPIEVHQCNQSSSS